MSSPAHRRPLRGIALGLCLATLATAARAVEGPLDRLVGDQRVAGAAFDRVAPFAVGSAAPDGAAAKARGVLRESTILALDAAALAGIRRAAPESLALDLTGGLVLELVRVSPFAPGFRAVTSDGRVVPTSALGLHYRGVVQGEEGSLAAISIFEREVMGFVKSARHGELVLGRLSGDNRADDHVLYPTSALPKSPLKCNMDGGEKLFETDEEALSYLDGYTTPRHDSMAKAVFPATVDIWVETDYDMYQHFGSSAAVTSYMTGVFNQSATLYANEQVPIEMTTLYIWTRRSPYKGSSSSALLSSFQKNRTNWTGNFAHLVALRGGGGIAAGFNGFCNADRRQSMAFSMLNTTYANVPTYSWTVMVFTHEMGHLAGSRHTHACVWNGNNTQIDGCYTPEGTCPQVGYPANGGTIMSYCHLSGRPGINFNNGFGPQPGNVIRSRYAAATCVQ